MLKDKINYLKKLYGKTTEDIITATNIPKGTLNKILSGETADPRMETLTSIAKYFSCSLDYLMLDEVSDINYGKTEENNTLAPDTLEVAEAYQEEKDLSTKNAVRRVLKLEEIKEDVHNKPKNKYGDNIEGLDDCEIVDIDIKTGVISPASPEQIEEHWNAIEADRRVKKKDGA